MLYVTSSARARKLCALEVMHAHDLCDVATQAIYSSVIIAKLLCFVMIMYIVKFQCHIQREHVESEIHR